MAAPKNFFVKTGTFKSTGVTGLTHFDINEGGSPTDVATDGSATITMTYLNNIGMTVTIDTTDASVHTSSNFRVGAAGSLVLVGQQRAEGKGPVGAADKTATFANAVLVDVGIGIPHEGDSTVRLTFRCSDPAGSTPVVWS
jgi:hypothetical protein